MQRHDGEAATVPVYGLDGGPGAHVNAEIARLLHQPPDKVWVKWPEHARSLLEYGDFGACAPCGMRKLEGDKATADENDPARQGLQFKKFLVGDQVLLARDAELHRLRSRGDQDVLGLQRLAFDIKRLAAGEAGKPMIGIYILVGVTLPVLFWNGIGKSPLEGDQGRPVDTGLAGNAFAMHATGVVRRGGAAYEHFFGIAPAQCARATKGAEINHRNTPSGSPHTHRGDHRCRPGANNHKVVSFHHSLS